MAAVERGECQRWAVDQKLNCYGVSLDGEAAFPSVEREIQVRELFSVGETGDYLRYSNNTYQNTECQIRHAGKIQQEVQRMERKSPGCRFPQDPYVLGQHVVQMNNMSG